MIYLVNQLACRLSSYVVFVEARSAIVRVVSRSCRGNSNRPNKGCPNNLTKQQIREIDIYDLFSLVHGSFKIVTNTSCAYVGVDKCQSTFESLYSCKLSVWDNLGGDYSLGSYLSRRTEFELRLLTNEKGGCQAKVNTESCKDGSSV